MNEGDGLAGIRFRRTVDVGLTLEKDLAVGRLVDAGKDLDERRFAGAVFAEKRQDFTLADIQRDVVERARSAKALRYMRKLQKPCVRHEPSSQGKYGAHRARKDVIDNILLLSSLRVPLRQAIQPPGLPSRSRIISAESRGPRPAAQSSRWISTTCPVIGSGVLVAKAKA